MGTKDRCLPFPRGETFNAFALLTMGDTKHSDLEGRIYEVDDSMHGTGRTVLLRVVKNDTGGAITVARKFAEFSAGVLDFGRRIGTFPCDTAGAIVKPVDDAYTVGASIPDDDLFYVVESGPCSVLTNDDTLALTAGDGVATDNEGLVSDDPAAAGEFVAGQSDITTTSATAITLVVHVNAGLAKPPAAG